MKKYVLILLSICFCLVVLIIQYRLSDFVNMDNSYNRVENMYSLGKVGSNDSELFYVDYEKFPKVVKWNLKKNTKAVILNEDISYINVVKNKIYYVNNMENNSLFSVDCNGKEKERLSDLNVTNLCAYKERLYFICNDDNNLYSVNLDGYDLCEIAENVKLYCFNEKNIYYISRDKDKNCDYINRIGLRGENKEFITYYDEIQWISIYNNNLYFNSFSKGIFELDLKNKEMIKIIDGQIPFQTLNVNNGILYYRDFIATPKSKRLNLDTKMKMDMKNVKYKNIIILNDKIFFYENEKLYCTDLMGENKKMVTLS